MAASLKWQPIKLKSCCPVPVILQSLFANTFNHSRPCKMIPWNPCKKLVPGIQPLVCCSLWGQWCWCQQRGWLFSNLSSTLVSKATHTQTVNKKLADGADTRWHNPRGVWCNVPRLLGWGAMQPLQSALATQQKQGSISNYVLYLAINIH